MHGSPPRAATGASNAEPAENPTRDADSGRVAGFKKLVQYYAHPSLTPRVSAPSAFDSGEEETPDSLILSASSSASPRLRVETELDSFARNSPVRVLQQLAAAREILEIGEEFRVGDPDERFHALAQRLAVQIGDAVLGDHVVDIA